ncbi:hypothetical protein F5Y04DRAFT_291571 [Hypomontagnella monticulosa]|nr:hypothetical protein F5Y04DRAFT_291571 [Hypomontagnella monticulosa]
MSSPEKRSSTSPSGTASHGDGVDATPDATRCTCQDDVTAPGLPSHGGYPQTPIPPLRASLGLFDHQDTPHPHGAAMSPIRRDIAQQLRQSTGRAGARAPDPGTKPSDLLTPALHGPRFPNLQLPGQVPHTPGSTTATFGSPSPAGGAAQPQQQPNDPASPVATAGSATSSGFRSSVLSGQVPAPETPPHAATDTSKMPPRRRRSRYSLLPEEDCKPPESEKGRRGSLFASSTSSKPRDENSPLGKTLPSNASKKEQE